MSLAVLTPSDDMTAGSISGAIPSFDAAYTGRFTSLNKISKRQRKALEFYG